MLKQLSKHGISGKLCPCIALPNVNKQKMNTRDLLELKYDTFRKYLGKTPLSK